MSESQSSSIPPAKATASGVFARLRNHFAKNKAEWALRAQLVMVALLLFTVWPGSIHELRKLRFQQYNQDSQLDRDRASDRDRLNLLTKQMHEIDERLDRQSDRETLLTVGMVILVNLGGWGTAWRTNRNMMMLLIAIVAVGLAVFIVLMASLKF